MTPARRRASILLAVPLALTLAWAAPLLAPAARATSARPRPSPTPSAGAAYGLADPAPFAKSGYYTDRILKFLDTWPPVTLGLTDASREIYTRAIKTPDQPRIIGIVKHLNIQAPFEKVVDANERYEDYAKVWENVVSVTVESRDRNRTVTEWVRKPPAFFMPKLKYRMLHVSDRSKPGRVVYRQQLIDGNALSASDIVVVLEKSGDTLTRISVVNFFDPDAGPFRSVVESVIWKKSFQNSYKDDVAFRAHLEHPDWDLDRLTDEAEKAWDQSHVEEIPYTELLRF